MKNISSVIRLDKEYTALSSAIRTQLSCEAPLPLVVNGLFGGAMNVALAEAIRDSYAFSGMPSLVLCSGEEERRKCFEALHALGIKALEYKERDLVLHNISASHDTERERLSVLHSIIDRYPEAIVTTPKAALSYTMPEDVLKKSTVRISVGDEREIRPLCHLLSDIAYARVETVESIGQFAARGDILDVWCAGDEYPIRIEFFGDEIDRLCRFDPITQRSIDNADELLILPASEVLIDKDAREKILSELDLLIEKCEDKEKKSSLRRDKNLLSSGALLQCRDRFISLSYEGCESLLSYFKGGRTSVFITDTNGVKDSAKRYTDATLGTAKTLVDAGLISIKNAKYSITLAEYDAFLKQNVHLYIHPFSSGASPGDMLGGLFGFRTRKTVAYGENPSMLFEDLRAYKKAGYRTLLLCENSAGIKSLETTLFDEGFYFVTVTDKDNFDISAHHGGEIFIDKFDAEGFELITPKIAVLSMKRDEGRRIMQNRRRQRILKKAGGAGERLMSYADLSVGDYVVHANYGIGLFEGIESVRLDGVTKDYITIKYAGTDKLFVPCDRLEYIGKYIGAREKDGSVKLSKMGTQEWTRAKTKAKNAVRDIAKDLIRLYAKRQSMQGFAFSEDGEMEREFDAAFEYELTEAQTVAIEEIKRDMQKPVPMNRLLCGDVGFGKTEVALRAAFKAITCGKQVAILVPTTILAMQHYRTACQRMREYAVNIEMLTRFKTQTEQTKILKNVARGGVDILIGTHKLLSKSLKFKNLGLLIVDEEQRFGVAQKEKLKEMAQNVDVLTLSATPIPRTLNMAMNGICDMSILDEAPGERKPVQTYVLEHNEAVIEDAIRKELSRGGQVLYLYNNTESIGFVADKIMRDIPEARVAYAHGQLERDELEDTWNLLVLGEIDVLVCTTIIETGVDLPNANTLIIENADRMGLSQLHQLRGRVGRSSRQAYAYFTYRAGKALSEVATKRLSAIRDYAEFGAGFKVALRDLEIRGAGNLLGAEQHGYIDGVGYDLYVKLLSEAVLLEEGVTPCEEFQATVDIKIDANIPERFINSSAGRMEMYKKISLIEERGDLLEIIDEMSDRYGDIPFETKNLLDVAYTRALLKRAKISKLACDGSSLVFTGDEAPDLAAWSVVLASNKNLLIRSAKKTDFALKLKSGEKPLSAAIKILEEYLFAGKE